MISFNLMTKDRIEDSMTAIQSILKQTNISSINNIEINFLINGGSFESYEFFIEYADKIKSGLNFNVEINCIYESENLGVAEGRNILFMKSKFELVFFIDDDAILNNDFSLDLLIEKFLLHPKLAIIAVTSLDKNGSFRYKEIPVKKKNINIVSKTTKFIGVCHIINKKLISQKWLYPKNLFYGMEEYYLSYKIISNGYQIIYFPNFKITHFKSDKTRLDDLNYYIHLSSNKIFISFLSNNMFLKMTHFILWILWVLIKSRKFKSISLTINRVKKLMMIDDIKKYKYEINKVTQKYFRENKGTLWY